MKDNGLNKVGMALSLKSIDMIIGFEISSFNYYDKFLKHPTYPQGESGITIGIGYDLGYNTKEQIESDWGGLLTKNIIDRLKFVSGLKGEKAKDVINSMIDIQIPLQSAKAVFIDKSIVRFALMTKLAFNGVEELGADAQGALVSLVYNRGSNTDNTERRKEMHNIVQLVKSKDYDGISNEIISMKRLWGSSMKGLLSRRDAEAAMVKGASRKYLEEELILV